MANDSKLVNLADLKEAFDSLKVNASQSTDGMMSAIDKTKLDEAASYKVIGPQSVTSVSDAIEAKAGKVLVNIEPVQSGSGDPSPDNVRPISGWTGATIQHTGNNICDLDNSFTVNDDSLKGTEIKISKGTRVYFQRKGGVMSILYGRKNDGSLLNIASIEETKSSATLAFDITAIGISRGARQEYGENDILMVSLTDFTELASYSGTILPISWQSAAGTVYGGTLDVTTGLLTVTMAEVDLGTLAWNYSSGKSTFYATVESSTKTSPSVPSMCDAFERIASDWGDLKDFQYNYGQNITGSGRCVAIRDPRYVTNYAFKAAMVGHDLVYELATPVTYQLTPTQIAMLAGENIVWGDTGDITVGYLREDSLGTGEAIADAIKSSDASHGQMVKVAMTKTFNDAIEVTTPTFSTLPKTFSAVGVTPEHELVQDGIAYLSNPSAMGSDWTIATGNDEFTISGTCNDSTYIKASFCVKQKTTATA